MEAVLKASQELFFADEPDLIWAWLTFITVSAGS
jgi:hypothetical protein